MNPEKGITHPKLLSLYKIPQHIQKSQEWLNQRKNYLTSSDAATPIGKNKYEKPHDLLFKKCGVGKPFTGNTATRWGEKYEDEAIQKYCDAMGMKQHEFGLIPYECVERRSDEIVYEGSEILAGSPDGIAVPVDDLECGEPVLLEVKCPYSRKIKLGDCPETYFPQVQLNMYICGLKTSAFIEYKPATSHEPMILNIVHINIDHRWLAENVPILKRFWDEVLYYRNVGIVSHPKYARSAWTPEKAEAARLKKEEVPRMAYCLDDD